MRVENLKKQESVVESVLFTMGQSVEIRQLAAALESDEETAIQAVERLKEKYDKRKAGMQIVRLDDSYQMCSRTDYYEHLIRVAATPKKQVLSDVVMETLAIIAYRQPVTRGDIEDIRGVAVNPNVVRQLQERGWIQIVGHRETPGRPALFATTQLFLDDLGLKTLADLPPIAGDLPQSKEFELVFADETKAETASEQAPGEASDDNSPAS